MVLLCGRKAEGEVCLARTHAFFICKHAQRQADKEAQGPDQDKHEDDQIHGGRMVRVGDDHGAGHGHGTQGIGACCQAEGQ